jgi:hypothetical protein
MKFCQWGLTGTFTTKIMEIHEPVTKIDKEVENGCIEQNRSQHRNTDAEERLKFTRFYSTYLTLKNAVIPSVIHHCQNPLE